MFGQRGRGTRARPGHREPSLADKICEIGMKTFGCGKREVQYFSHQDPFNSSNVVEGCFCRAEGSNLGAMLITHVNHQQLYTPSLIYSVPTMHSLCSSQNKEERTTDSQYRHPLPHQRDTQTAHPQSYTSSPADETSLQMSSSSMSSVIHPHIQENVVTHFTTFTTDINSQSGHSTNLNNSRTLESQQKIQRLYPSDSTNSSSEPQDVQFPKCVKVYFTNKWNGASVIMYKYADNEGNVFVSGKPRVYPILKDTNQFDCLLSCTKEALKLSKEIHGDTVNTKLTLENLPESLLVLLDPLVQSVTFEVCGSALPHLVKYDFKIDAKPLFITKLNGTIVPYKLYILSQETTTSSSHESSRGPYDDIGPIPMDQKKVLQICEEFKQVAFNLNENFRRAHNIPLSYYFESFIIEGKVIYFLNEENELVSRDALFKVKPKDIELFHWEQFDATLQAKALDALSKIFQRDLPIKEETIRKEMELSERGWMRFARDIMNFIATIPNSFKFRKHPPLVDVVTFPDYENTEWFHEYKMQQKVIVMVGLPGSGKSSFAERLTPFGWVRVNQDELGSRRLVEIHMEKAIRQGFDVIVDRCNFDYWQRNVWIRLCQQYNLTQIWCVFFDIPPQICKNRVSVRTNHPTIPKGESGFAIVDKFVALMIPPKLIEGFIDIITIKPESDIDAVVKFFSLIVHKPEHLSQTSQLDASSPELKKTENSENQLLP